MAASGTYAGTRAGGPASRVPPALVAAQWTRLGCVGFGGPPTHISPLRWMCVEHYRWMSAEEFEHGIAAANLLPGPAPTSWPSTARGGCAARAALWSAGSASSCPV